MEIKVGDRIKGWTVARIYEHPKWYDLGLVKDGGKRGSLRIMKPLPSGRGIGRKFLRVGALILVLIYAWYFIKWTAIWFFDYELYIKCFDFTYLGIPVCI